MSDQDLPSATEEELEQVRRLGNLNDALLILEYEGISLDIAVLNQDDATRFPCIAMRLVGLVGSDPLNRQEARVILPHDLISQFAEWLQDQHGKIERKHKARIADLNGDEK